jgi:CheY-like chemotaxis protein
LRVEDTGIGISPENQARIFDGFVQIGKDAARNGTGLGLTITREFVTLLGGTIRVESALGQGSTFCVELPVELQREADVIRPAGEREVFVLDPGEPEYRILIVDDDEQSRFLLERLLQNAGFGVRSAGGGLQGLDIFRSWRPHFIWMDVLMPSMDGPETARRIRALEGGRDVKIAAVSASVFTGEQGAILAAGIDDFVGKPYRPSEIFDCMARHLGARFHVTERAASSHAEPAPSLPPEALTALPLHLRAELRDAVIRLDAELLQVIIGRVSERDSALGSALSYYADRFEYTPMLRALESAMRSYSDESL